MATVKKIGSLVIDVEARSAKFQESFKKINKNLKRSKEQIINYRRAVWEVRTSLNQAAVAVTALSTAFSALAVTNVAGLKETNRVADAFKTTTGYVLALERTLIKFGGTEENALKLFEQMSNQMQALEDGSEDIIKSFATLGLSLEDLQGIPLDERLGKTLDALSKLPDSAKRNQLQIKLFSDALLGVDLDGFSTDLNKTSTAFKRLSPELTEAGKATKALAVFQKDLSTAFRLETSNAISKLFEKLPEVFNKTM